MSKNAKTASDVVPDGQTSDFVLDFLYHDVRRVGSFLAQFDDAGHLREIRQSDTIRKSHKRGWSVSLGGGLDDVGSAQASAERGPSESGSETSDRIYDPLWANPLTLLDYLEGRGMINRDIWGARIGQFALASGHCILLDIAMLRNAWDKTSVRDAIRTAVAHAPAAAALSSTQSGGKPKRQDVDKEISLVLEMLQILPHSIQILLVNSDANYRVWCSIEPQYIVGLSSDLVLKHGALISGDWSILGVVDALPEPLSPMGQLTDLEQSVAKLAGTAIGTVVAQLSPLTRRLLGRPHLAHGMTPLLIYREVAG